jgi:hypothetical protein
LGIRRAIITNPPSVPPIVDRGQRVTSDLLLFLSGSGAAESQALARAPVRASKPMNIYRKSAVCELSPKVGDSRYREPTQGRRDLKSRPFQFSRRSTKNISRSACATRPLNIFGILPARWRVTQASIVAAAVPTTPGAPGAPGHIIVMLVERISRVPGRAIGAPGVIAGVGDHVLRHCGSCQHGRSHCGSANQSEFHHAFLLFILETQMTKCGQRKEVPVPKR